jgi:hypothetical protein
MTAGQVPGPIAGTNELAMPVRQVAELADVNVAAAIRHGIGTAGEPRHVMFTDAAIAAAIQTEALGAGPYPVAILSRFVRAGGITAALRLPEPLVGVGSSALARSWLEAALAGGSSVAADLVFARWLEMVGTVMAARRSIRSAPGSPSADPSQVGSGRDGHRWSDGSPAAAQTSGTAIDSGGATAGTGRIARALRGPASGAHTAGRDV